MNPNVVLSNERAQAASRPRSNNPMEAMRQIAAIRLRELREMGSTHTEIADMFGLTPGRVQQLCGELCGEDPGEYDLCLR